MARGKKSNQARQQEHRSLTTPASPTTEFPASAFKWVPLPDGRVGLVAHVPNHVHLYPMTHEYAAALMASAPIAAPDGAAAQEDHDAAAA